MDMKLVVGYAVALFITYQNWTDMGPDNERRALSSVRDSQGFLIKLELKDE
jgi:hypothetical protein